MKSRWVALVVLAACVFGYAAYAEDGEFIVDAGTIITIGKFTYQDATVDISQEFFNPRLSAEYKFPERDVSLGLLFSSSKNTFDLDYDDGKKILDGTLDVSRTEILPFVRFGSRDETNIRLGYRMFKYEYTDAELDETRSGVLTKMIRDGEAEGKLSTGIDAELNLVFGDDFQFVLMLGGSYFINAKYEWSYMDMLAGGMETNGTAKLNALSLRIAPGITWRVADQLRICAHYQIEATSWLGSKDDEDEEYAGTDIMSGLYVGIRYVF